MSIEQKINYQLNKFPAAKKVIKRVYQLGMYAISPKIKSEGDIVRVSPEDGKEYFFGYYDKSPWDASGRFMLCLRADDTWSDVSPRSKADILLIDTQKGNAVQKIAETSAWNVQQSCMLQWLGSDYTKRIIYNDYRDEAYVSVILDIETGMEKVICAPVYTVSQDGKTALTLDFSRLYNLRPGYGYYNVDEITKGVALPDADCIWKIDLETGEVVPILKYTDFASFQPRNEMLENGSVHKVNHLMLSPNGKRFMVLYRWFNGQRKYTRLVTCNVDGTDMYILSDDDMVSHCYWKNDNEIIAYENKKNGGPGYYLMKDKTQEYIHLWAKYTNDGHPSYSPMDETLVVTDSYPNRARIADIKLIRDNDIEAKHAKVIARVFAPFKYDNDTRCDLHPRWSRDGKKVCFDSVFEGHRGLYVVDIKNETYSNNDNAIKKRIIYVFTSCKRSGPVQIMYNLIAKLDRKIFEPILITLYDEVEGESDLVKFISIGVMHYRVQLGKKDILLNKTAELKKLIDSIKPSIIHSMGVFPDYVISKLGYDCQVITLHNYMHEDYTAKFGLFKGFFLEKLQTSAIKKAAKVWTCSESLAKIYRQNNGMDFDYIRNGVDVAKYKVAKSNVEKNELRRELNLSTNKTIFIYVGQFIDRKDQRFLLNLFSKYAELKDYMLLMLGSGVNFNELKNKYGNNENFIFAGNVSNVEAYLKASDYYISCSHSEGLPTSVLEAMACGLPVVLSDIMQHKEIIGISGNIGDVFILGDEQDCLSKILKVVQMDRTVASTAACYVASTSLSSEAMSKRYQDEYKKIIKKIEE